MAQIKKLNGSGNNTEISAKVDELVDAFNGGASPAAAGVGLTEAQVRAIAEDAANKAIAAALKPAGA